MSLDNEEYERLLEGMRSLLSEAGRHLPEASLEKAEDGDLALELIGKLQQHVGALVKAKAEVDAKYRGYHDLIQNMQAMYTMLDNDGWIVEANPYFREQMDWSPEHRYVHSSEFTLPDDMERYKSYFKTLQEQGYCKKDKGRLLKSNGEVIHVMVNSVAVRNEEGAMIGSKGVLWDITEKVEDREKINMRNILDETLRNVSELFFQDTYSELDKCINEALASLGSFFNVDRSYVFTFDNETNIMSNTHEWCNEGVTPEIEQLQNVPLSTFGWWTEQILNKDIINIPDVGAIKDTRPALHELLASQSIQSLLCVPMVFKGESKGFLGFDDIRSNRVWSEDAVSLLTKSAEIFISVIENYRINEEKEQVIRELARANEELADFAYTVSHDLKAPLRGMVTIVDWIREDYTDKLDEEGLKQLGLLQNRALRLGTLIDDILDYSSLNQENKEGNIQTKRVFEDIERNIDHQKRSYEIQYLNDLPVLNRFNYTRIYQMFYNLIVNAIYYNDNEKAIVKVGYALNEGNHVFTISDNGIGIAHKYQNKIFEIFQRLDTNNPESTGIGLAIVRKVANLYDGTVTVDSIPGQGAKFTVSLPKRG